MLTWKRPPTERPQRKCTTRWHRYLHDLALPTRASLLCDARQIFHPYQPILAGERQRLVCALRLGHTEDAMVASIVDFYTTAVFDYQSSWKNGVPKFILCANSAGCSEISGPP